MAELERGAISALVRALPFDMPVEEVIVAVAKQRRGVVLTKQQVYRARTLLRVNASQQSASADADSKASAPRRGSMTDAILACPLSMDVNEVIDHLAKLGMTAKKQTVWQARYEAKKRAGAMVAMRKELSAVTFPHVEPPPAVSRRRNTPAPLSELSALQQRISALTKVSTAIDGLDEESVSWVFDTLMTALTKPRRALDRTVRESYGSNSINGQNE